MRPKQKVTRCATNSARCATQKNPDEIVHRGHLSGSKSNTQPSSEGRRKKAEGRKQKFKQNQRNLFRPHSRCLRMPAYYLSHGPLGKTRIKANDPQCKLLRPGPKIRHFFVLPFSFLDDDGARRWKRGSCSRRETCRSPSASNARTRRTLLFQEAAREAVSSQRSA